MVLVSIWNYVIIFQLFGDNEKSNFSFHPILSTRELRKSFYTGQLYFAFIVASYNSSMMQ